MKKSSDLCQGTYTSTLFTIDDFISTDYKDSIIRNQKHALLDGFETGMHNFSRMSRTQKILALDVVSMNEMRIKIKEFW